MAEKTMLEKVGDVLIIKFGMFDDRAEKFKDTILVSQAISVPLQLDMSKYYAEVTGTDTFRLSAVIQGEGKTIGDMQYSTLALTRG